MNNPADFDETRRGHLEAILRLQLNLRKELGQRLTVADPVKAAEISLEDERIKKQYEENLKEYNELPYKSPDAISSPTVRTVAMEEELLHIASGKPYVVLEADGAFSIFDGNDICLLASELCRGYKPSSEEVRLHMRHWAHLHQLTQEVYQQYLEFQICMIRCLDLVNQEQKHGQETAEALRITASDSFERIGRIIEDFAQELQQFPHDLLQTELIREAYQIRICLAPVRRFIGIHCTDMNNKRALYTYRALIIAIGRWLLDILRIVGRLIEVHFREMAEERQ